MILNRSELGFFLFNGERFVGRLPELNLTSNVFDMFGDSFVGVSRDSLNPLS
jgi:PmbA protein